MAAGAAVGIAAEARAAVSIAVATGNAILDLVFSASRLGEPCRQGRIEPETGIAVAPHMLIRMTAAPCDVGICLH
jgi:hypothetical protein